MRKPIIETGVDKLILLVNERKKISTAEAAQELSVPKIVVEEWANFLEEKGIIDISYKLTTPYLVKKGISKKEIQKKSKEYMGHREGFLRKVESTLAVIEKETAGLKDIKKSFVELGREIEEKSKIARKDLDKLQWYQQAKRDAENRIKEGEKKYRENVDRLSAKVSEKQRFYKVLMERIVGQELKLNEEKEAADELRKKEEVLLGSLDRIRKNVPLIKKAIEGEERKIGIEVTEIEVLRKETELLKAEIEETGRKILEEIRKNEESKKHAHEAERKVLEKISKHIAERKGEDEDIIGIREKFEGFVSKKVKIDVILDKINTDIHKLETELLKLVDEATIIQLSMKAGTAREHIAELENRFQNILKKKKMFEQEILKLYDVMQQKR